MPIVVMPDGMHVDMPEPGGAPGWLKETGRVADKALRGGVLALPGLVGDVAVGAPNWLARKTGLIEDTTENTPGKEGYMPWPSDALQTLTGGDVAQPQTKVGKVAGHIGEAVVGTMAGGPGVSSLKQFAKAAPGLAKIGLGAGVGGETAAAVFDDNPIARLAGGLVGGGATAVKQAYKMDNTDKVARKVFDGIKRSEVEDAIKTQAGSANAGLDLNLAQALGRETNVDAVLQGLANSSEGKQTTALLRAQPLQVKTGMQTAVNGLPGQVRATRDIANRSQEVATDLIETAKQARTASWKSAFDDELARIQEGPKDDLKSAIALASRRATELIAAKSTDATAMAGEAATNATRAKVLQALEAAKAQPAPLPAGVGARGGVLLDEAKRGDAALSQLATHEAKQAQLRGEGVILDASGKPFNTAPAVPPAAVPGLRQVPAAESALAAAKGEVTAATSALEGTTAVPTKALSGVYEKLTRLADANGNPAIKRNLLSLRDGMVDDAGYITDAGKLNDILKYAAHQTKPVNMQTSGLDAGASKYLNGIITGLRKDFGEAFSPVRAANERFAANTEVAELKKSTIGELAGRAGAKDDVNAAQGKLLRIIESGTEPKATRSEILATARALNKSDPTLFADAAKTWISTKLSEALNTPSARDSMGMASAVTKAFGSPQHTSAQTRGLADTLAGMAEAQGLPTGSLQALPKFLNFVAHAAERPGSTSGVTAAEIGGLEASSAVGRIGHVSKITMLRQPILAYTNRLQANTRAELDRLLSSPEGIRMLHDLSRTSPWTDAGQKAISAFIAAGAEAQGE